MKSFILAFAFIALAAADVSHLNLNREYLPPDQQHQQHHHHHHAGGVGGGAGGAGAASSVSVSAQYNGQGAGIQTRIGGDVQEHYQQQQQQSQDIPDSYAPLSNDISVDVPAAQEQEQEQDVPAAIGADTYTPAHLVEQEQSRPGDNSASYAPAQRFPGDSSSSHTPAHLIEQEQSRPGDNSASYAPAQRFPGDSSSSHTPAHLLEPEHHHEQAPAVQEQEQYTPAEEETQSYQSTQSRFGGGSVGAQASSGIDTQYGTNGGYVY